MLAQKMYAPPQRDGLARTPVLPERAPQAPPRPSRRAYLTRRLWVFGGIGYAIGMAFCLLLIYRNALWLEETTLITRSREQLATLQQQNQDLTTRVMQTTSVAEVEKWALSMGMVRPNTIRTVKADPTAVAPPVAPPPAPAEPAGFWVSVRSYLARMAPGQSAGAAAR